MASSVGFRHPTLYYDDGSFVICCRDPDTRIPTYYRPYGDHMSRLSDGIRAILNSSTYHLIDDNVPLVEFEGKTPADMERFLTCFYVPWNDFYEDHETDVAFKMEGAMELADMLLVEGLKENVIDRIKQDWPMDLRQWDLRQSAYSEAGRQSGRPIDTWFPEPASVVRFARRYDSSLNNPILLLDLCNRLNIDYGSGTTAGLGARWHLIPPQDRRVAINFRRRALRWVSDMFLQSVVRCNNQSSRCQDSQTSCAQGVLHKLQQYPNADILQTLTLACGGLSMTDNHGRVSPIHGVCYGCMASWESRRIQTFRESLFAQLPEILAKSLLDY